jgi:hypothetical protein
MLYHLPKAASNPLPMTKEILDATPYRPQLDGISSSPATWSLEQSQQTPHSEPNRLKDVALQEPLSHTSARETELEDDEWFHELIEFP